MIVWEENTKYIEKNEKNIFKGEYEFYLISLAV